MAGHSMINSDIVMPALQDMPTIIPEVTVKAGKAAGTFTYSSKPRRCVGTLRLVKANWHPTLISRGEWDRTHVDESGKRFEGQASGKLYGSRGADEMIELLLDQVFGRNKWKWAKKGRPTT